MILSPTIKDRLVDKFLAIQQWAWRGQAVAEAGNIEKIEGSSRHIGNIIVELETLIEGLKRHESAGSSV